MFTVYSAEFVVRTEGKGTYEVTDKVAELVRASQVQTGLVNVFLRHTSASLLIFENADVSARRDLEKFFERLVPEGEGYFSHTIEGPDDMPSHIRMALTRTSESIPVAAGQLRLRKNVIIYQIFALTDPLYRIRKFLRRDIACIIGGCAHLDGLK